MTHERLVKEMQDMIFHANLKLRTSDQERRTWINGYISATQALLDLAKNIKQEPKREF